MFIQLQFLSPYKISHTFYDDNTKLKNCGNSTKLGKSILTTNIHIFYISLFLAKAFKSMKVINNKTSSSAPTTKKLSCFFLPTTKKTVIFLRAPYKNKLARLNILQINHRFVISGIITVSTFTNNSFVDLFKNLNFSSFKIKHVKTNLKYYTNNTQNFNLHNYN